MSQPPASPGGLDVPADLLDLDPEELRRLGHWVVDRTVEHLTTLRDRPALTKLSPERLAALGGPVPFAPNDPLEGLRLLADLALEAQQHGDHPRYFARVPGPSSPVAILGEWLAVGLQAIASSWGGGSGTATVELVALGWLRDALGLAPHAEGIVLTGGSLANLTALITARSETAPAESEGQVLYLSDQTHSSIRRGALAIGWRGDAVRILPTGDDCRLAPDTLVEAIVADVSAGLAPAVVVATAGTTNTGAVDDLRGLAAVARTAWALAACRRGLRRPRGADPESHLDPWSRVGRLVRPRPA